MSSGTGHVLLANLLTDYGASREHEIPEIVLEDAGCVDDEPSSGSGFEQLLDSSTSALEDAYSRGFEEGQRETQARVTHELGEQAAAAELKLEEVRRAWAMETGEVLAQQLDAGVHDMHHKLADNFSDVLLPIINEEVRREAVRKIASAIKSTTASDWQGPLRVEGPSDLIKSLQDSLGEAAAIMDCHETAGADIMVSVNDTILKTQLAAWGETVKRILS